MNIPTLIFQQFVIKKEDIKGNKQTRTPQHLTHILNLLLGAWEWGLGGESIIKNQILLE